MPLIVRILKGKQSVNDAIKSVHDHYHQELGGLQNYDILSHVMVKINALQSQFKNSIYIQYVTDWLGDLVATYGEIAQFNTCNPTVCCPKNDLFPFHVLIGISRI